MDKQLLWNRITHYEFDDPNALLTFTQRLGRDNHWSFEFAKRVVEEYRKFCFLCVTDGPCTPSDIVDQCWHQHLIYTRQYWQIWCKEVLEMELHHGPTLGGKQEGDKFEDWYSHTKQAYFNFFNELPPEDIWPDNETRFTRQLITLDTTEHLIVKVSDYPWLCKIMVVLLRIKHYFKNIQKQFNVKQIKIAIIAMLVACASANAQSLPNFPDQAILDQANMLTQQQEAQLNERISEFEKKTSMEIRLVTISNTSPAPTASAYAEQLYRKWKLGDKNKNNGLLLVIAKEIGSPSTDMKDYCRIMTGYGIQTIIPDMVIIDQIKHKYMMPNLPHQPYRAFSNALDKIFDKVEQWRQDHPEDNTVQQSQTQDSESSDGSTLLIILLCIVGGIALVIGIGAISSSSSSSSPSTSNSNYYSSGYNDSSSSDKKKKKDKDSGSSGCSSNSSSSSWWSSSDSSSGSSGCSSSSSSSCGSSCGGGGCGGGGCGS